MASSNSSVAYDLSAYQQPKQKAKPDLKMVKSPRSSSMFFSMPIISSFAIVVTLISIIVYNQVQLTEVTGEINSLTAQLEILESENVRMTADLEAFMSLRTIGEQAKSELGMNRLDKYQTEYIYLEQEDKIELTENTPAMSWGQKIEMRLTGLIRRIQEYLSLD